jgi:hypothetical protein
MSKLAIVLVCAVSCVARAAGAEPVRISAETDPSLFALNGYGVSAGASVAPHWHVQVTAFASDLYKFATPADWHARIARGSFFWLRYYVDERNEGWFVGATLAALDWKYTRDDSPGMSAEPSELAAMPFVGYRWFPTTTGFYVLPWAGLALPFNTIGSTSIGSNTYEPRFPVFPLAAIHVGYEWGR